MTIKELRVKKRLTQDEFAQAIGVHKRTVSAWERGIIVPSAKKLRIIEEKFKAKLSY
jgi:transcriptional regulator with XRE-family HTH domain